MFRLVHLTDPHLGPLPVVRLRELLSKRIFGYANWRRSRRHWHTRETLDRVVEHALSHNPDHIAVTGDLVNIALPGEFEYALEWLKSLGSPEKVSVVPGNHDAYVALPHVLGLDKWQHYMAGDRDDATSAASETEQDGQTVGTSRFPYVRRRGRVSLIGVSSAVPSPVFMAVGRLGSEQRSALASVLKAEREAGQIRVLMIHHPPYPEGTKKHKRLTDHDALMNLLKEEGVELAIYGHNHRADMVWFKGPDGLFPVVGGASASQGPNPPRRVGAGYNLFEFQNEAGTPQIAMRHFTLQASGDMAENEEAINFRTADQETVTELLNASSGQA
ncbi:MAG: metallophosphoesterase [Pseudomonadota bacterium]